MKTDVLLPRNFVIQAGLISQPILPRGRPQVEKGVSTPKHPLMSGICSDDVMATNERCATELRNIHRAASGTLTHNPPHLSPVFVTILCKTCIDFPNVPTSELQVFVQ